MRHPVVRAAQLEREHRLLVLALEKDAVPSRRDNEAARSSGDSIATS
jgi:hypothetical protein